MTSRLACVAPLAAAIALSVSTAAAAAPADIVRFDFTTPIDDVSPSDDCRPGVSATITGPERLAGQRVDLADGSMIFRGVISDALTFSFSDGSTGAFTSSERFAGPSVVLSPDHAQEVVTFVHHDAMTVRDAAGAVLGMEVFRAVEHIVLDDYAPFGPSDNDVVRVGFEHPRLTCDGF